MSCTGLYANSPLVVWWNICITEICKCFVFILEYTNPCLEENSFSSDPQTHTCDWLREWAHAPCTHTHTYTHHYILTIRRSSDTLIRIDSACMHATHHEHLPKITLPHDHSWMSRETEPRSSVTESHHGHNGSVPNTSERLCLPSKAATYVKQNPQQGYYS